MDAGAAARFNRRVALQHYSSVPRHAVGMASFRSSSEGKPSVHQRSADCTVFLAALVSNVDIPETWLSVFTEQRHLD